MVPCQQSDHGCLETTERGKMLRRHGGRNQPEERWRLGPLARDKGAGV